MSSPFEEIQQSLKEESIKDIVRWWEKRRIRFNLAVGITGLFALLLFTSYMFFYSPGLAFYVFGILFYGIIANVFYTLGWASDIYSKVLLNDRLQLTRYKNALFIGGTLFSMAVTFILAFLFGIGLFFID
ncbi:MAG: hypothetical protein R3B47_10525 [Bacteroidia bacterium]